MPRRQRLHRIAEATITIQNSGSAVFRDEKPYVFSPYWNDDINLEIVSPAFYNSREIKEIGTAFVKIKGARSVGVLLTPKDVFVVYNLGNALMKWDYKSEMRTKALMKTVLCRERLTGYSGEDIKGLLLADGMELCYEILRVVIPLKEMFSDFPANLHGDDYKAAVTTYNKLMNSMLGAKIDFIVKGIDSKSKSIVASRREAMYKKRQTFYMETDKNGMFRIYEDRIVQARVIAVAEKAIRVEIFGVDCSIPVKDLSWDWIGDARERFSIGDEILLRIKEVKRDNIKDLYVSADARSVTDNRTANLELCKIYGKYAGRVTDTHKGVVYIRLNNGVNAIAHTCLDRRMPGKKDDVSFAVTTLDKDKGIALGVITRIIKQNL